MMTKEEYKKEIVRMWDSLRDEHKGDYTCFGVNCDKSCALYNDDIIRSGCSLINAFEAIEAVGKWSKEHPPKKHKISQLEYDILDAQGTNVRFGFYVDIRYLLSKGYFEGATSDMLINDYLENCEVVEK